MIALDFDDPVLDRAAGAASFFQLASQLFELGRVQRQAVNGGHAAALTAFGFPADPDNAVAFGGGWFCFAGTGRHWSAASGADAAVFRRVDQSGLLFLYDHLSPFPPFYLPLPT